MTDPFAVLQRGDPFAVIPREQPGLGEQIVQSTVEGVRDMAYAAWLSLKHRPWELPAVVGTLDEESRRRSRNGAAWWASMGVGAALGGALPVASSLLGKVGLFATSEAAAGATFGAIAPLEGEETRGESVVWNALAFPLIGGATTATLAGVKTVIARVVSRLAKHAGVGERQVAERVAERAKVVEHAIKREGVDIDEIPPKIRAQLNAWTMEGALRDLGVPPERIDAAILKTFGEQMETESNRVSLNLVQGAIEEARSAAAHMKIEPHPIVFPRERPQIEGLTGPREVGEAAPPLPMPGSAPPRVALPPAKKVPLIRAYEKPTVESEYITSIAVRGKSGRVYTGLGSHQSVIDEHIAAGVPKEEFAQHERGFATNLREFIGRDEAARVVESGAGPLFSEQVHGARLLPYESPALADLEAEAVAKSIRPEAPSGGDLAALAVSAVNSAIARLRPLDVAEDAVRNDALRMLAGLRTAEEVLAGAAPSVQLSAKRLVELAMRADDPEKEVLIHLAEPTAERIAAEKELARREAREVLRKKKAPKEKFVGPDGKIYETLEKAREAKPREAKPRKAEAEKPTEEEIKALSELATADLEKFAKAPLSKAFDVPPYVEVPVRETGEVLPKMDGLEIIGSMSDEYRRQFIKALGESGAVSRSLLVSLAMNTTGGLMYAVGHLDQQLDDSERSGLKTVGALLFFIGMVPAARRARFGEGLIHRLAVAFNPRRYMTIGKKAFDEYLDTMAKKGYIQQADSRIIEETIGRYSPQTANVHRAVMLSIDEGFQAPETAMLTPDQLNLAKSIRGRNLVLGVLAKKLGVLKEYQENYVRHLLPKKSYERWRIEGFKYIRTGGSFTKERIFTLRELEDFTKQRGLDGPIMDVSLVHSYHLEEIFKAIANAKLLKDLELVGAIRELAPHQPLPKGWRVIRTAPLAGKIAPEAEAIAIDALGTAPSESVFLQLKNILVRAIMFWWWEHGINGIRAVLAETTNPKRWVDGIRYWRQRHPIVREMAEMGVELIERPDLGLKSERALGELFSRIGLAKVGDPVDRILEKNNRFLWNELIPAFQTIIYTTRMQAWLRKTKFKFGPGTPEYIAQAKKAAEYTNTVLGRIPTILQSPQMTAFMKYTMFSPKWTSSRIAIWTAAMGEVFDILAGRTKPGSALYARYKMRQYLLTVAVTYLASMLITGKPPVFNPATLKFYWRTGLKDKNGREIGVDMVGWWQDEVAIANDPLHYFENRLNPMVRLAGETITGRDYFGREMTYGQRLTNIATAFGPPAITIPTVLSLIRERPPAGEIVRAASDALAVGNVASIPPQIDLALLPLARMIVTRAGVPATRDNVHDVMARMRSNIARGRWITDDEIAKLLAVRRKKTLFEFPLPGSGRAYSIWQETKRVLGEF